MSKLTDTIGLVLPDKDVQPWTTSNKFKEDLISFLGDNFLNSSPIKSKRL